MKQIWSVLVNWGNGFRNGAMLLVLFACSCLSLSAEEKDSVRVYTEEHPLIYEDAWDLWPYVFLNENGEAVGYNVDLLKMIFQELDIPYVIKLKPTKVALEDWPLRPEDWYGGSLARRLCHLRQVGDSDFYP